MLDVLGVRTFGEVIGETAKVVGRLEDGYAGTVDGEEGGVVVEVLAMGLVWGGDVGGEGSWRGRCCVGRRYGRGWESNSRDSLCDRAQTNLNSIARGRPYSQCTCYSALGRPAMNYSMSTAESLCAASIMLARSPSAAMTTY